VNTTAVKHAGADRGAPETVGRYRWVICALLFFATTINYIDRQVLGILAPLLQTEFGWKEIEYGYIVTAFLATSAGFLLEWTGSSMPLFIISGSVYLIALFIINLLVPDLEPATIDSR
jgi:hypothetical protein